MKSIYITSVERYSGKTAVCLTLARRLKDDGFQVGYLKPLSLQPWRIEGEVADEDAAFVKDVLDLPAQPSELSPVVVTPELLFEHLRGGAKDDLLVKIQAAYEEAAAGQDVLLLEGGGSLREGYVVGLPTLLVAQMLSSHSLAVVKYRDQVRVVDDTLAAAERLGDALIGVLINRVPAEMYSYVSDLVVPYLEEQGITIFGLLPEVHALAALSVGDLARVLDAEILTKYYRPQAVLENLTVGAMTAEAALSRLRKYSHTAVITGGDRTDIQLAALETSTTCMVLTGNLRPSPLVLKQAEEFGVSVLLVRANTMETVEQIDNIYGKTRLGQIEKLNRFQALLDENVDFEGLYSAFDLVKKGNG